MYRHLPTDQSSCVNSTFDLTLFNILAGSAFVSGTHLFCSPSPGVPASSLPISQSGAAFLCLFHDEWGKTAASSRKTSQSRWSPSTDIPLLHLWSHDRVPPVSLPSLSFRADKT